MLLLLFLISQMLVCCLWFLLIHGGVVGIFDDARFYIEITSFPGLKAVVLEMLT